MQLPTGTVTFLFTDIEGSTRLLQRLGAGYRAVQDDHARILRRAIDEGGGVAIRTEGDSFFAVFPDHAAAVRAAVAAQRALASHPWPTARPCGYGWACTPGAESSAATTTSAST
jgi:class 3 adenylate cyclase